MKRILKIFMIVIVASTSFAIMYRLITPRTALEHSEEMSENVKKRPPPLPTKHIDDAEEITESVVGFTDVKIKREASPPKISDMQKIWDGEAAESTSRIEGEDFAATLHEMADFESSYGKLIGNHFTGNPFLPWALQQIMLSRRYLKLVESIESDRESLMAVVLEQLSNDLNRLDHLQEQGQSWGSDTHQITADPNGHGSDLLYPLGFRVNSCLMLIAATSYVEGLPLVLESAERIGKFANPAALAYAVDKILTSMVFGNVSRREAEARVLQEYEQWKQALDEDNPFKAYGKTLLPHWTTLRRPGERASLLSMTPPVPTHAMYEVEVPPVWVALKTIDPRGLEFSASSGDHDEIATASEIIRFGNAYLSASQE